MIRGCAYGEVAKGALPPSALAGLTPRGISGKRKDRNGAGQGRAATDEKGRRA
jgi:hypothetical protein